MQSLNHSRSFNMWTIVGNKLSHCSCEETTKITWLWITFGECSTSRVLQFWNIQTVTGKMQLFKWFIKDISINCASIGPNLGHTAFLLVSKQFPTEKTVELNRKEREVQQVLVDGTVKEGFISSALILEWNLRTLTTWCTKARCVSSLS